MEHQREMEADRDMHLEIRMRVNEIDILTQSRPFDSVSKFSESIVLCLTLGKVYMACEFVKNMNFKFYKNNLTYT